MELKPRIVEIEQKHFLGMKMSMSLIQNRTAELWRSFMPRRKELNSIKHNEFFSLQMYPSNYFDAFNPHAEFEKWALQEVDKEHEALEGFTPFTLEPGLYAVFEHKGSNTDTQIFQDIYSKWLPQSGYALDQRPHFEVLGEKYKNNDPESEEEIWIPIVESLGVSV